MSAQLALNLRLRESASFANFHPAANAEALDCLRRALDSLAASQATQRVIYLWGAAGSGRTHLLQAACHRAQELGLGCAYLPLAEAIAATPASFDGLESTPVVALDDLQMLVSRREWETAVFTLAECVRARAGLLLVAASAAPTSLGLSLPDLVTRLSWGPVYALRTLADDDKLAALQLRANRLGLELPADVARYVLARYPRDMHTLFAWLDRADRRSLASQRRLTIPFIRGLES